MTTMTIKLTHSSNVPGAEGEPGDVITCDAKIAAQFLDGRGAVIVSGLDSDVSRVSESEPDEKPAKATKRKPRAKVSE